MSNNPVDAPGFIANVISQLNTPGANLNGDSFAGLTQDEDASALEFLQQDNSNNFTFNFALARVRLIGKTPGAQAKAARVFFRLFQAQSTGSDFNEQTTYRFATDGAIYGHKIARLGVQNSEYVTIPCFASPRINFDANTNSAVFVSMDGQNDPPNARDITVNPGQEVDTYFGCWLDINQPQQQFLPMTPPAGNLDGPWNGIPLHSLNEVISKAPHQCLIAEIRFELYADTSRSDVRDVGQAGATEYCVDRRAESWGCTFPADAASVRDPVVTGGGANAGRDDDPVGGYTTRKHGLFVSARSECSRYLESGRFDVRKPSAHDRGRTHNPMPGGWGHVRPDSQGHGSERWLDND